MLKKLTTTVLPIVFAVLLALALDAWYDGFKEQSTINSTLMDIAMDIDHYAGLHEVYDYNQAYLDTLSFNILKFESGERTNFIFGFGRPEINSLAWEMAKENGIASGFGRELYKDIAGVYVEFDRLIKLWDYNYQFKLERDPDMSQYTLARHFHRQMTRIQDRHAELQEKSKEFLEKYRDASFISF